VKQASAVLNFENSVLADGVVGSSRDYWRRFHSDEWMVGVFTPSPDVRTVTGLVLGDAGAAVVSWVRVRRVGSDRCDRAASRFR